MDDDDNPIDRALNLAPASNFDDVVTSLVVNALNDSAKEDFTYARSNIRDVIDTAACAIDTLSTLASQSQNSKDFEALSKLMDTVINASEKLLKLQKSIREIDKADEPNNPDIPQQITNNLFVG
ncbi:hypothetical protein EBU71_21780, partial [bacterium]|nr:hypothetical protein [Candidatus Elulimicrobium humile]